MFRRPYTSAIVEFTTECGYIANSSIYIRMIGKLWLSIFFRRLLFDVIHSWHHQVILMVFIWGWVSAVYGISWWPAAPCWPPSNSLAPVNGLQLQSHFFKCVSHSVVDRQSSNLSVYLPHLLEFYFIGSLPFDIATFLCCWHSISSLSDHVSILFACLIEFSVHNRSIFFFDKFPRLSNNLYLSDFRFSAFFYFIRLVSEKTKINLNLLLYKGKSLTISTRTLLLANLGRAKRNSFVPPLSGKPFTTLVDKNEQHYSQSNVHSTDFCKL